MKVLIDTNVALDILLKRQDYLNAEVVYSLAEKEHITGYITASAITDIFFLLLSAKVLLSITSLPRTLKIFLHLPLQQ